MTPDKEHIDLAIAEGDLVIVRSDGQVAILEHYAGAGIGMPEGYRVANDMSVGDWVDLLRSRP